MQLEGIVSCCDCIKYIMHWLFGRYLYSSFLYLFISSLWLLLLMHPSLVSTFLIFILSIYSLLCILLCFILMTNFSFWLFPSEQMDQFPVNCMDFQCDLWKFMAVWYSLTTRFQLVSMFQGCYFVKCHLCCSIGFVSE